jgi:two-component system CheB/CheR fusion protein
MLARRILVVDDSVDGATSLAATLRISGHEVHVAHDGLSAILSARRVRPSFLILDLAMKGLDGFQVAILLRADPEFDAMRIIALTGHSEDDYRMRSQKAGINHHLIKPVDPQVLERLLA